MNELSDQQLLVLVQQDDGDAFTALYLKYSGDLYSTAYKRTCDRELSQDIVQIVFADLWSRRKTMVVNQLSGFLHGAVRNQVFKMSLKAPARSHFLRRLESLTDAAVTAEDPVLEKDYQRLIELWIAALPGKRRNIFLLFYKEDLSTAEISDRLGISRKTVQNQLHSAAQQLRLRFARFFNFFFF